ncbi:MAG: ABC transporter permease [Chloroflexota bacterium]|jgi:ABC-2 type transport system permease protein
MSYTLNWLHSYRLLLQWQALRLKPILPFILVIQPLVGIGTVIGLGYMMPQINTQSAIFLTTGGPTLALITFGLVMVPQVVADAKTQGTFDYMWSLPIPRMAFMAADMTIWMLITLPGVVLALLVGSLKYDFALQVTPSVVPAFLLVSLTATAIGYAIAHLSPKPELVAVLTNFIIFSLFLFSPINFPAERLPEWLADLHQLLPVKYAADAIRGSLTEAYAAGLGRALIVLAVWCVASLAATYTVVSRRR